MSACDICDELAAIRAKQLEQDEKLSILLTGVGSLVAAASGLTVDAVDFGSGDAISLALSYADSPTGTMLIWLRPDAFGAGWALIKKGAAMLQGDADGTTYPYVFDSTESNYVYGATAAGGVVETAWNPYLMAWKTNETAGNKILQLYRADTDIMSGAIADDGTGSFSSNWSSGTLYVSDSGTPYIGAIAEFWVDMNYMDISVESNRRKFFNASHKPIDLGSDGSTPTGSSPLIYLSVRPGDAATDFVTNRGTAADFTITGTLAIASTSPSD